MKMRIDASAWEIFGSGSATCKLEAFIGGCWKRIEGDSSTAVDRDNGFVGLRSTVVELYPKTKVRWVRAFHPGSKSSFQGTWAELCRLPLFGRVKERL